MKKNLENIFTKINPIPLGIGSLFTIFILLIMNFSYSDSELLKIDFPQEYKITTPLIPKKLYFAGEQVPLEDTDVYEIFEREFIVNTYFHSSTIFSLKRARRWFPVIEPILKNYGIPDDFKYLVMIESNFMNIVSTKNAVGFWQLIKSSAEEYGLEVNNEVDERYHVEKSTEAACKYLLDAYNQFGSWTFAAAAYNAGIAGIKRQIAIQKETKFYDILFNEETTRYIARILSIKYIFLNPSYYGYYIQENELYKPYEYKEIIISDSVNSWTNFAKANGITYKKLKKLNPWLRDVKLTNKAKKTYIIKLPD